MNEYIFYVEHTVNANTEEEARHLLQEHLDAGNLMLSDAHDWLLEQDAEFIGDDDSEPSYDLCMKCQVSKEQGSRCPSCGHMNE